MLAQFYRQRFPAQSSIAISGTLFEGSPQILLSRCQTEPVEQALAAVRGEFAAVMLDAPNKAVIACCDQLGMRALFYAVSGEQLSFSTTVAPLLALPDIDKSMNAEYLAAAFSRSLCAEHPYEAHTLYKGVRRLPGGHYLHWTQGKLTVRRYWYPAQTPIYFQQDQAYVDGFYEKLSQAVQRCLPEKEIVALEVSGGIDSLAVATVTRQCMPAQEIIALSNTCPDAFDPAYQFTSEKSYADAACQHLCIRQLSASDEFDCFTLLDQFEGILPGFVEDLFSFMSLSFYQQAQQAGATVLLSGFGGDQIATQHAVQLIKECWQKKRWTRGLAEWWLLNGTRKGMQKILLKALQVINPSSSLPVRYQRFIHWLTPLMQTHLQQYAESLSPLCTVQESEARYMQGEMSGFLTSRPGLSNLFAQHYGVRHRYPMLDVDLLNYCHNVPAEQKRRWGIGRRLVRKALLPHVPKALILRDDKTSATCPLQIIQLDRTLLAYFKSHPTIPKVVHDYIQWPKLQEILANHTILDPSMRRALLYIVQLERLNQRFGFLD